MRKRQLNEFLKVVPSPTRNQAISFINGESLVHSATNTQYFKSEPGVLDEDTATLNKNENSETSPNIRDYLKQSQLTEIEPYDQVNLQEDGDEFIDNSELHDTQLL